MRLMKSLFCRASSSYFLNPESHVFVLGEHIENQIIDFCKSNVIRGGGADTLVGPRWGDKSVPPTILKHDITFTEINNDVLYTDDPEGLGWLDWVCVGVGPLVWKKFGQLET